MTHPATATERFAALIDALCQAVARRGGGRDRLDGPLVVLIWRHLRRLGARIAALAARIQAGRHRRHPARRPPRPAPRRRVPPALPHGPAWLLQLVPEAAFGGSHLQSLLAEPEMAALLAAAPQMRRLLRPLCRMLGVRPPPAPRPASPPAEPAPPAAAEHPAPPAPPSPPHPAPRLLPSPSPLVPPRACGPPVRA